VFYYAISPYTTWTPKLHSSQWQFLGQPGLGPENVKPSCILLQLEMMKMVTGDFVALPVLGTGYLVARYPCTHAQYKYHFNK